MAPDVRLGTFKPGEPDQHVHLSHGVVSGTVRGVKSLRGIAGEGQPTASFVTKIKVGATVGLPVDLPTSGDPIGEVQYGEPLMSPEDAFALPFTISSLPLDVPLRVRASWNIGGGFAPDPNTWAGEVTLSIDRPQLTGADFVYRNG